MGRLPSIFGPSAELPASPLGGRQPGQPASKQLALSIPKQEQNNWCWAAVAAGIGAFYNGQAEAQCGLATKVLGKSPDNKCCTTSRGGECDHPFYLDSALQAVGCFVDLDYTLPFQKVSEEIDQDRTLGIRVEWPNGSGHFVAVGGWRRSPSAEEYVTVHDPWEPRVEEVRLSALHGSYGTDRGRWTHSYLTAKSPPARPASGRHLPSPSRRKGG